MKAKCINIKWTSGETKEPLPIYSLDFHPSGLLATGAGDRKIQMWRVKRVQNNHENLIIKHLKTLDGHYSLNINCVRFSPSGQYLASGADKGELFVWNAEATYQETNHISWSKKISISLNDDIFDLSWARDETSIAIALVNKAVVVCNTTINNHIKTFNCHKNIVQGIAWDPLGVFIVTESADRSCRIFGPHSSEKKLPTNSNETAVLMTTLHTLYKRKIMKKHKSILQNENSCNQSISKEQKHPTFESNSKSYLMFFDENGPIFRRLSWSPDGSFLAIPAGVYQKLDSELNKTDLNITYLFSRKNLSNPMGYLPALDSPTSVSKWCPVLFKNRKNYSKLTGIHYRMYLAVACKDSIFIYDTESLQCVVFVGGLHLASITDISWTTNGTILAVSSRDGYCSFVSFSDKELGERF